MENTNKKILSLLWGGVLVLVLLVVCGIYLFPSLSSKKSVHVNDYNQNNFDQVINNLKDSKDISDQLILAASYLQKGGFTFNESEGATKALSILSEVLVKDPKNSEALRLAGYAYELTENYDKAIEYDKAALAIDTKNAVIVAQLAHVYLLKGGDDNIKKSQELAMYAYKLLPGDSLVAMNAARVYIKNKDYITAESIYTKVSTAKNTPVRLKSEALYDLSSIYLYYDPKIDLAIKAADDSLAADPGYYLAYIGKGRVLHRQGKGQEAFNNIKKAIELHKNSELGYEWLGIIYHDNQQYDASLNAFNYALTLIENDNTLFPEDYSSTIGRLHYFLAVDYADFGTKDYPNTIFSKQKAIDALEITFKNIDLLTFSLIKDAVSKGKTGSFASLIGIKEYDAMAASLSSVFKQ